MWDKAQCGPPADRGIAQINAFGDLEDKEPLAHDLNKSAHAVMYEKQKTSKKQRKKNSRKPLNLNAVKALPTNFASLAKYSEESPWKPPSQA